MAYGNSYWAWRQRRDPSPPNLIPLPSSSLKIKGRIEKDPSRRQRLHEHTQPTSAAGQGRGTPLQMKQKPRSEVTHLDETEHLSEPSAKPRKMEQKAQMLKQKNNRLSRSCTDQESEIDRLSQLCAKQASEIDRLSQSCTHQSSEIDRLSWSSRTCQNDYKQLQKKNIDLQQDLQTCKDDLFRLQPAVQKPDTEIVGQYEQLCQKICSWIDQEIAILDDNSVGQEVSLFSPGNSVEIARVYQKFPRAGEFRTRFLIHCSIQQVFFQSGVCLFGLLDDQNQVLQNAEQNMTALEPSIDKKSIGEWRSLTLKAFANDSDWTCRRNRKVKEFSERVFDGLAPLFAAVQSNRGSFARLHQSVSLFAAKLELDVHLSSSTYSFVGHSAICRPKSLTKDMLNLITVIDAKTAKTVKSGTYTDKDSSNTIGRLIMCVEPGLLRQRNDMGGKIVLKKATFLADLTGQPLDEPNQLIKQERA